MKSLSNLFLYLAGSFTTLIVTAFTIKTLWGWFIVTTFNLPTLTLGTALGLDLVISYLISHVASKSDLDTLKEDDAPVFLNSVGRSLFFSGFFLVMGYLVHHYM